MSSPHLLPETLAPEIASYAISPTPGPSPASSAIEQSQALHRIRILNGWANQPIRPGARVLELGCGQGTCTQALGVAVGATGHVDAVDPAPSDYGSPFTLGEAQAHLLRGPLGARIAFHCADPVAFLQSSAADPAARWDVAVLAHCIWYFASAEVLAGVLGALRGRVDVVCVAEYALRASEPAAVPHVLAALAATGGSDSTANIRTPLSPRAVKAVAARAGWRLQGEDMVVPDAALSDGFWEAAAVVADDIEAEGTGEFERVGMAAARDATVAAVELVGGVKNVRTMDVWVATLVE
ncbi:hypothetical protein B0T22DRAFT_374319 [Podospora appendiculata]|uniref:Methyltransferase domain-containing protein n=1 Tax=Podospora appendiculata TaxID=314037 RepID=A0AAE0XIU3_9PEZI|nr:hypothetical protein B0T22DRAFT_374319 [Podospora appendiculata]